MTKSDQHPGLARTAERSHARRITDKAMASARMTASAPRHTLYAACVIHFGEIQHSPDWPAADRAQSGRIFDAAMDFISARHPVDGAAIRRLIGEGEVYRAGCVAERALLRVDLDGLRAVIKDVARAAGMA